MHDVTPELVASIARRLYSELPGANSVPHSPTDAQNIPAQAAAQVPRFGESSEGLEVPGEIVPQSPDVLSAFPGSVPTASPNSIPIAQPGNFGSFPFAIGGVPSNTQRGLPVPD